jgi:hypothetical protein
VQKDPDADAALSSYSLHSPASPQRQFPLASQGYPLPVSAHKQSKKVRRANQIVLRVSERAYASTQADRIAINVSSCLRTIVSCVVVILPLSGSNSWTYGEFSDQVMECARCAPFRRRGRQYGRACLSHFLGTGHIFRHQQVQFHVIFLRRESSTIHATPERIASKCLKLLKPTSNSSLERFTSA